MTISTDRALGHAVAADQAAGGQSPVIYLSPRGRVLDQARCRELADVLEHPAAYRLPAMTANKIADLTSLADGQKKRWKEFDLTSYYFPGQTLYHGALLAERDDGAPAANLRLSYDLDQGNGFYLAAGRRSRFAQAQGKVQRM